MHGSTQYKVHQFICNVCAAGFPLLNPTSTHQKRTHDFGLSILYALGSFGQWDMPPISTHDFPRFSIFSQGFSIFSQGLNPGSQRMFHLLARCLVSLSPGQGPAAAQGVSKGAAAGRVDGAHGGNHLHGAGPRGGSLAAMLWEDQGRPRGGTGEPRITGGGVQGPGSIFGG